MVLIVSWEEAKDRGLSRYFTGEPCKHGHVAQRITINKLCHECVKIRDRERGRIKYKAFRMENPVVKKERKEVDIEKKKEWQRQYYLRNREKQLQESRERYKLRDKKAENERLARYAAQNPEKVKERKKAWKVKNPDAVRSATRNRRAMKRQAEGNHTQSDIHEIYKLQRGCCAICRVKVRGKYHVDHIKPLSRGGSNARCNLQITCATCNIRKKDRDPIEHMQSLGFLL
jgi:5-methylcytosine-specific restriction endonuclease McrA